LPDGSHALAVELHGRAKLESGALLLDGKSGYLASKPLTEDVGPKTLEAWVRLDTLQQSGGGVLTLQDLSGEVFDSIVFAEREPGRWLAGSDFGRRSQSFGGPAETEASDRFVHVAIVYEADGTILAYRNGEPYGKPYKTLPPIQFKAGQSQLLIGNRHGAPIGNRLLQGAVRRARLYNRPLSPEEIRASYRSQPYSIPRSELFALLPEKERREYQDLIAAQGEAEAQLKSLETRPGLSSEWADLAHAIFNLKEFVYVQ
jgi:hypothetical protein